MKIKQLSNLAKLPTRAHDTDAGYDLYAAIDAPIDIVPHATVKIGTGFAIALPNNTFGAIVPRSGISSNRGLRPANTPGTIDQGFRGEVKVALHNDSYDVQTVEPGERIAQLIVIPFVPVQLEITNELDETERADGGFGSTGRM